MPNAPFAAPFSLPPFLPLCLAHLIYLPITALIASVRSSIYLMMHRPLLLASLLAAVLCSILPTIVDANRALAPGDEYTPTHPCLVQEGFDDDDSPCDKNEIKYIKKWKDYHWKEHNGQMGRLAKMERRGITKPEIQGWVDKRKNILNQLISCDGLCKPDQLKEAAFAKDERINPFEEQGDEL